MQAEDLTLRKKALLLYKDNVLRNGNAFGLPRIVTFFLQVLMTFRSQNLKE
jgi:hypothetical protein